MSRRTSVTLPNDLYTRWKAGGLTLAALIRRGLDDTGDEAGQERDNARLLARWLDQLTARPVPGGAWTAREAAAAWGCTEHGARHRLFRLTDSGYLRRTGSGDRGDAYHWAIQP